MEAPLKSIYAEKPERMYIAVDGPKNAAGDDHALSAVGMNGWTLTFISRDCADPEKAIRLLSYLVSEEGSNLVRYGLEGEDYVWQDGRAELIGQAAELFETDYPAYVQQIGANNTYWMMQSGSTSMPVEAVSQIREWAFPHTVNVSAYEVSFEPGSEAAAIDEQTRRLWGQTLPALLLAPTREEFDRILGEYVAQREQMGWDILMQARTEAYAQNNEKLARLAEPGEVDDEK